MKGEQYPDVVINGVRWMAGNVGTPACPDPHITGAGTGPGWFNDGRPEADYGAFYQWGRGHMPYSPTNPGAGVAWTAAVSIAYGGSSPGTTNFPSWPGQFQVVATDNWNTGITESASGANLFLSGTSTPDNDPNMMPCPAGYQIPSQQNFTDLVDATAVTVNNTNFVKVDTNGRPNGNWSSIADGIPYKQFTDNATGNNLLLPAPGYRGYSNGQLYGQTSYGYYWVLSASSTTLARRFYFTAGATGTTGTDYVGDGFSLRCIKI